VLSTIYLPTEVVLLPKYYNSIHFAAGYGQVIGIMAAFVTIGSLGFERLSKRFSFASLLRFAIIGVPLTMIPMAFLPPQWAMLLCGALLGVAWGPLPALVNTVILRKVAPSKRGRVFALEMTIWTGGPMLSMTVAGIAVDAFGVKPVYMFIALTVLAAGILISTRKAVRELDVAEFQD
jgi:MFS family permease